MKRTIITLATILGALPFAAKADQIKGCPLQSPRAVVFDQRDLPRPSVYIESYLTGGKDPWRANVANANYNTKLTFYKQELSKALTLPNGANCCNRGLGKALRNAARNSMVWTQIGEMVTTGVNTAEKTTANFTADLAVHTPIKVVGEHQGRATPVVHTLTNESSSSGSVPAANPLIQKANIFISKPFSYKGKTVVQVLGLGAFSVGAKVWVKNQATGEQVELKRTRVNSIGNTALIVPALQGDPLQITVGTLTRDSYRDRENWKQQNFMTTAPMVNQPGHLKLHGVDFVQLEKPAVAAK